MQKSEFVFNDMTPELQAYIDHEENYLKSYTKSGKDKDFYKKYKEKSEELLKSVQDGLLVEYKQARKAWMCRDEIKTNEKCYESPSKKYKLVITWHKTGENSWNYTKGKIYKNDELITEILRNYSSFPFLFIEGHQKGDFLVCGEDYQGQTIVELSTGKYRSNSSNGADEGYGFCWAEYKFDEKSNILTVCGCHWACPYEFRFFDFSDPMSGWQEIELDETVNEAIYEDNEWPLIDGETIKTFNTNEENDENDEQTKQSIKTFKRENNKLILIDEWMSDSEKERRKHLEKTNHEFEFWKNEFRSSDPLYLVYKSKLKEKWLNPSGHESIGITYDGWCQNFKKQERRWCRRIHEDEHNTFDLEWAVESGPVKLVVYKDGKHIEDKFFDHTPDGINKAFDSAQLIIRG